MNVKLKRMAGNLAVAAVALALGLGLGELVLRTRSEVALGFRYENGVFGMPREYEWDRRRNAHGFHDRDHGPKAPGARRVLLLGDSYVVGYSVPLEATVGYRLEHHLGRLSGEAWEVMSIGRNGWSQVDELEALREHGPAAEADLVLTLFLPFNDVVGNSPALERSAWKRVERGGKFFQERPGWGIYRGEDAPLFLFEGSKLNQLVSYRLAVAKRPRGREAVPLDYLVYRAEPTEPWRRAWELTDEAIETTRDEAAALGAGYAVVSASTPHGVWGAEEGVRRLEKVYPALAEVEIDLDAPDRRLARICDEREIPFLALEPTFRDEHAAGARLHWAYDGHWNEGGNDLAGRLMAEFVLGLDLGDDAAPEAEGAVRQAPRRGDAGN